MDWQVTSQERTYLRELAKKQAEYAALPVMQQRKRMWYDLNDNMAGARPPVVLETWTFARDFMPESVLHCQTKTGKSIERKLLNAIRNHELIDDDKVMPDYFGIGWFIQTNEFGLKIPRKTVEDYFGHKVGFEVDHPIKDIRTDLDKLQPSSCTLDRQGTLAYRQFVEDLLGDILPVRMEAGWTGSAMLTHRLVELMGMEAFFLAMYDSPDQVHRLMAYLRDNALNQMRWRESQGLLELNHGNQASFGSSYNFTNRLPSSSFDGTKVRQCDMWGAANSQETVGISTEMFREFCLPYYRAVSEPMGLLYYGCCEPVHPFWEEIQHLPHLKKVSISRWCDQAKMGQALRGNGIIYSRKPDPNYLGVDEVLNEEAWAAHIRETLDHTRGVLVEFIIRDVYTLHGNLEKGRRAVQIARQQIDKHYHG